MRSSRQTSHGQTASHTHYSTVWELLVRLRVGSQLLLRSLCCCRTVAPFLKAGNGIVLSEKTTQTASRTARQHFGKISPAYENSDFDQEYSVVVSPCVEVAKIAAGPTPVSDRRKRITDWVYYFDRSARDSTTIARRKHQGADVRKRTHVQKRNARLQKRKKQRKSKHGNQNSAMKIRLNQGLRRGSD